MTHVTANFQGKWQRETDMAVGFTTTDGKEYFATDIVIKNRIRATATGAKIDFFWSQMPGTVDKIVSQYTVIP